MSDPAIMTLLTQLNANVLQLNTFMMQIHGDVSSLRSDVVQLRSDVVQFRADFVQAYGQPDKKATDGYCNSPRPVPSHT